MADSNKPIYIIIHCSDVSYKTLNNQLESINTYHRDVRGFPILSVGYHVGYHKLITGDKMYTTRLDTDEGSHCNQRVDGVSMNFQSLGICIGFDGDIEYPKSSHVDMLAEQIRLWQYTYDIPDEKVLFHRDLATDKTCPGSLITKEWLKRLLTRDAEVDKTNPCVDEKAIIKEQEKVIKWYESIFSFLRKLGLLD